MNYRYSLIGIVLAVIVLMIGIFGEVDFFEHFVDVMQGVETFEVDEFVFPVLIILGAIMLDVLRRARQHKIELEKLRIYQAMLRSAHHILNNFLNQVLLVKITAEKTPGFDPEVLELYEQTIKEASGQIQALGNLEVIDEDSIQASVAPRAKNGIE